MRNFHIYPNAFKFESRILKETKTLTNLSPENTILIISLWEPGLNVNETIDARRNVARVRCWTSMASKSKIVKAVNYFEFFARVILKFGFRKVDVVNCHSLTVMPLGLFFKIFRGKKLIYDTHELETERVSIAGLSKLLMKMLEKICIVFADKVIVVSHTIGKWYEDEYKIKKVYVVMNVPQMIELGPKPDKYRQRFGIPMESIIFLYQGYLMKDRAIEFLLDIFSKLDDSRHIVFMGYGVEYEKMIREFGQRFSNIHFHEAVKMNDLPFYSASADVGISLTDSTCLSYRLSMGNKFFEYINAEIPYIFWIGYEELNQLNNKFNFGWNTQKDFGQVTTLIKSLTFEEIRQKAIQVKLSKASFDWRNEEKELIRAYEF